MASWAGITTYATKKQLISSISGLYSDIQDISGLNFFNLDVSTLTASLWLSTPVLYVSDIQGASIDISGVTVTDKGVFNAPIVSLSTMSLKGFDSLLDLDVSFDLGLGKAVGGLLGGLGALVGGGIIGVGTGAGLAIQGAETGLATLIAGRPSNTITSNTFETINFTSQLQVSTLGSLYPLYSTIYRTVSSSSANEVPGPEIFVSTFFEPGQICIRSISDPFNLITADSNLNTSTIQSFGQWTPLSGLEPEFILADSVSTNNLSSGLSYTGIGVAEAQLVLSNIQVGLSGSGATALLEYQNSLEFVLGAGAFARQVGDLNLWWYQTDKDIVWSKTGPTGTTPINAELSLGFNADESLLTVSSIFSRGDIQANSGFFSTLTVEALTVVSTVNLTSTNVENVTSSATVEANRIYANYLQASTIFPYTFFSTIMAPNPSSFYDINRTDTLVSTSYDQISSLQQNVIKYSLNAVVQDEALFDIGDTPPGALYKITPQNVTQWGSTILQFSGLNPGQIDLGWVGQWGVTPGQLNAVPGGATFDVFVNPQANSSGITNNFGITQESNNSYPFGVSTLFYVDAGSAGNTTQYKLRFTLPPVVGGTRSGWWDYQVGFTPYESSNNNTFQVYQDINDTYIQASDRLHLVAGDVFLDGKFNLDDFQTTNLITQFAQISTMSVEAGNLSTVLFSTLVGDNVSSITLTGSSNYIGSVNNLPPYKPIQSALTTTTTDFINQRFLTVPSRGPNLFNSYNIAEWNNTMFYTPIGTSATTGPPQIYLGDIITPQVNPGAYSAQFYVNNTNVGVPPIPIYSVETGGWLSTVGFASASGTGITLVQTNNGTTNWTLTCNIPNPQGSIGATYSNYYNVRQQEDTTFLDVGMPLQETMPSRTIKANKVLLDVNQIRCRTFASPSYQTRDAGFELTSYFDQNVVFDGSQSDAVNPIISPYGNLGYPVIAWSPQIWFGRIRTKSFGIQGFEVEAVVQLVSGSFADFIWASHRYLNVVASAGLEADIREIYFMVPFNWMTQQYLVGPY